MGMDLPHVSGKAAVLIGIVMLVLLGAAFLLAWGPALPQDRRCKRRCRHSNRGKTRGRCRHSQGLQTRRGAPAPRGCPAQPGDRDLRPHQRLPQAPGPGHRYRGPRRGGAGHRRNRSPRAGRAARARPGPPLEQSKVAAIRAEQEYSLNQSTLTRYEAALRDHAVADQDVEERRTQQSVGASALKEAQANAIAADAAVKRLAELQGFEKVVAPFSGVLTTRGYDAGALITASDTSGKELFRLEQTDVLRASASVPQSYATDVKIGQAAELLVGNYPDRPFAGTVARTSGAINSATRMMTIEVDTPNHDALLLPGMYGQLRSTSTATIRQSGCRRAALVFGSDGMRVAVIEGGRAHYRSVTLGKDFGTEVEVVAGISAADQLVNNPGELKEGAEVVIRTH